MSSPGETIHEGIEEWVAGAICGGLSAAEEEAFERHLAECAACQKIHQEQQIMSTLLENSLQQERPAPDFENRMVRAFREQRSTPGGWLPAFGAWALRTRSVQLAGAAAMLVALVQVGVRLTREKPALPTFVQTDNYGLPAVTSGPTTLQTETTAGALVNSGGTSIYTGSTTVSGGALTVSGLLSVPDNAMKAASAIHAQRSPMGGARMMLGDQEHVAMDAIQDRRKSEYSYRNADKDVDETDAAAAVPVAPSATTAPAAPTVPAPSAVSDTRKLIRNANMDWEVASFDAAVETITSAAGADGGFVATKNSTLLANGKREGMVTVKVLPDHLDAFLARLRGIGELKNQAVSTEDITKAYFDTDARLRNAKRMEDGLLRMLDTKTNRVADLLEVERELGRVREGIEEMQGQLKVYDADVQYATVTISISEKELNQPAAFLLKETAELALYASDVEKTCAAATQAARDAGAQIVNSRIERDEEGRVSGTLSFLLAPDTAELVIAKMKALGRVETFTDTSERVARDGEGQSDTAKVERDKVQLNLGVVHEGQEAPVQRADMTVLATGMEHAAAQLKDQAAGEGVTVESSTFERGGDGSESAELSFLLPMNAYQRFVDRIEGLGKVETFTVHREDRPGEQANAPVEIALRLHSQGNIVPNQSGLVATFRRTLGEAFAMMMWSVRMIGVALAFLAPWAAAATVLVGAVYLLGRRKRPRV